jgi:citrate synthase
MNAPGTIVARGLDGVVVEKTKLSLVDGEKGLLVYCGYDIDEAAHCSFEEICYLFLYGKLPTAGELYRLDNELKNNRVLPETVVRYISESDPKEHPMAKLRTAVSMLSATEKFVEDQSPDALLKTAISLVAKAPTIGAAIARVRDGKKPIPPDTGLSLAADFLRMSRGEEAIDEAVRTLDLALVLHADHGLNASTFTARVVASSLSDMVSSVTAAIGSLKGPLHGGANTEVMHMLLEIGSPENVEPWLKKSLQEKRKIMGFGHRVYKVMDPRAKHLKKMSEIWGKRVGNIKWFDMSTKLEALMMQEKHLNPNVDFYSASTYYAMGIDPAMYTVIFAISRMVGWSAHVMEQLQDNRLMRPEAEYVGPIGLKYVPMSQRD